MATLLAESNYLVEVIEIMTLRRVALIFGFPTRAKADGFIELNGRLGNDHILTVRPFAFFEGLGRKQ